MIKLLKNVFAKKKEKEYVPDPPGRTFKRILTGRCFGCENINASEDNIAKAKQSKIDQIQELELLPVFIKYSYKDTKEEGNDKKISSAHVAFQKEVLDEKWKMVHVTEISFTIDYSEFDEFEQMSGVSLHKDFRDLTPQANEATYQGKERRKERREA